MSTFQFPKKVFLNHSSGEVSTPRTPQIRTILVSRIEARNQRSPEAQRCTGYVHTFRVRNTRTEVKARGTWSPSEARHPPHHCAPAPF